MRPFRSTIALSVAAIAVLGLSACNASTSSSVSSAVSSAAGALEQAKTEVCGKLDTAQSVVTSAEGNGGQDLSSTAASIATDLNDAASLLKTVGATDASIDVQSLATDLQNIATASPDQVAQYTQDAQEKISSAQTALSCPGASMATPGSTSTSPSP